MDLHYKKDGSLDMRFNSSKAASSSSSSAPSPSSSVSSAPSPSMSSGGSASGPSSNPSAASSFSPVSTSSCAASNDLHRKKDGTLDMRFNSSKAASGAPGGGVAQQAPSVSLDYTPKKDGTPDMRFNDSKTYVANSGLNSSSAINPVESFVPKKDGTPDMRFNESRTYVQNLDRDLANMKLTETSSGNQGKTKVVDGKSLPVKKDGTLDMRYSVNRDHIQKASVQEIYNDRAREQYWDRLMQDYETQQMWTQQQRERVIIPKSKSCFTERDIRSIRRDLTQVLSEPQSEVNLDYSVPANIQKIPDGSLDFSRATKELGKGAFGVVLEMNWQGKTVAVKKLYTNLTRNEKQAFQNEVCILAQLGRHTNLVEFYGYSIEPPCIVMELVELGSLNYLLHYCEDRKSELKIADGRVKKNLVIGIVDGMDVLHEVGVVHGDLKPQNILVSNDWVAKITDFGLANLRGKASTMIQSNKGSDEIVGGTGGYMAPELLDYTGANPPSSDLYSFGIMLNEIVTEQEPYSDQYKNFAGRGANAAANYARLGNRPRVSDAAGSVVKDLIKACWDADGKKRPDFASIAGKVRRDDFVIPNGPRT